MTYAYVMMMSFNTSRGPAGICAEGPGMQVRLSMACTVLASLRLVRCKVMIQRFDLFAID